MRGTAMFVCVCVLVCATLAVTVPVSATPTGSPLVYHPIDPCRALDTRAAIGPLAANTAMDVYVRGSVLPPNQGGQSDCGIPPDAESVIVDVHVIGPTATGYLRINSTGSVNGPNGPYSRIVYNGLQFESGSSVVSLCGVFLAPHPYQPCAGPVGSPGLYSDFQILNSAPAGTSTHVAVDVTGYFVRMPLTGTAAGDVTDKQGTPPGPVTLSLSSRIQVVCAEPYIDPQQCDSVQLGWGVVAAGHVVIDDSTLNVPIYLYAHRALHVDQN
jgi:hypothetical protein